MRPFLRRPSGERDTTLLKYKLAEQRLANEIFKKKKKKNSMEWNQIETKSMVSNDANRKTRGKNNNYNDSSEARLKAGRKDGKIFIRRKFVFRWSDKFEFTHS